MATERQSPDAILELTNLSGVVGDIQDDPDSPNGNWLTYIANNLDTICRVSFPTPTGNPTIGAGLQQFQIWVRKQPGTGTPSVSIDLYENGVLVANIMATTPVTSPTGELFSITWDANLLGTANGSLVECYIFGDWSNGGPSARCTVEVGAVEWNVTYTVVAPPQTITAAGNIGSSEAFGVPQINLKVLPFTIDTAEAFGLITLITKQIISNAGAIVTLEAFGSPKLNLYLSPLNITSLEAFGIPTVNLTITPSSIATTEAFGSPKLALYLLPLNIQSKETFGTPIVTTGAQFLQPLSITSTEAFGSPQLNLILLSGSIISAEVFGTQQLNLTVLAISIVSQETFGNVVVVIGALTISPVSITTVEEFGSPKLILYLIVNGIISEEVLGIPGIVIPIIVFPVGIVSNELFGDVGIILWAKITQEEYSKLQEEIAGLREQIANQSKRKARFII